MFVITECIVHDCACKEILKQDGLVWPVDSTTWSYSHHTLTYLLWCYFMKNTWVHLVHINIRRWYHMKYQSSEMGWRVLLQVMSHHHLVPVESHQQLDQRDRTLTGEQKYLVLGRAAQARGDLLQVRDSCLITLWRDVWKHIYFNPMKFYCGKVYQA